MKKEHPEWISPIKFAKAIGISRVTARNMAQKDKLKAMFLGGQYWIHESEIGKWRIRKIGKEGQDLKVIRVERID